MILPSPAPDFTDPLALLHACHGRIEKQCATLLKLTDHLARHGADIQARQAAEAILKYFSSAGQHHHADEEEDLFPLLRLAAQPGDEAGIVSLLDDLVSQHQVMSQAWDALQPWLAAISQGRPVDAHHPTVAHFVALYRAHIAQEEASLLPYAAGVLTPAQLQSLGARMAARRGLGYT